MSIDLITQWCVFCEYPLFREHIQKYRANFNKVILYPSRHHGVIDLESFAKQVFPETWVEPVKIDYGTEDWRQAETVPCLKESTADWVWFREQDFFITDWDKFYEDVFKAMETADMIGYWNPTHYPYVHPCCLLMKRELLDQTNRDFSAHPEINGSDHFAQITRDAEKLGAKIVTIQDLGYTEPQNMYHLGGLTYSMQNWKGDGTDHFGVKSPEMYYAYLYRARQANVKQSDEYLMLSKEIEKRLSVMYPDFNFQDNEYNKFFV